MDIKKLKPIAVGLLGVAVVFLVYLWTRRGSTTSVSTGAQPQQAGNIFIGGVPASQYTVNTPGPAMTPPDGLTTIPNTSQSGVPNGSTGAPIPAVNTPAPGASTPSFFYPIQQTLGAVAQAFTKKPPLPTKFEAADGTEGSGSSCGCGGSCTSCMDSCSNSRYVDGRGGCMALNRRTQIRDATTANPDLWSDYQSNIQAAFANPTQVVPGQLSTVNTLANQVNQMGNWFNGLWIPTDPLTLDS